MFGAPVSRGMEKKEERKERSWACLKKREVENRKVLWERGVSAFHRKYARKAALFVCKGERCGGHCDIPHD